MCVCDRDGEEKETDSLQYLGDHLVKMALFHMKQKTQQTPWNLNFAVRVEENACEAK